MLLGFIEELCQVINEVVHITEINEWSWVSNFAVFEEVLHLHWVVTAGLTNYTLNFLVVLETSAALDVLEVDVLILSVWKNIHEVVDQTFIGSVSLKNLNDSL